MPRSSLLAFAAVAIALSAGCKHREEAAKQQGGAIAASMIQQPIDRAHAVAGVAEKAGPALFDPTTMLYHKPGCKNADPGTMETMTIGQAEAKGAKADPVCFPAP